jgi:hypothetical protein
MKPLALLLISATAIFARALMAQDISGSGVPTNGGLTIGVSESVVYQNGSVNLTADSWLQARCACVTPLPVCNVSLSNAPCLRQVDNNAIMQHLGDDMQALADRINTYVACRTTRHWWQFWKRCKI